MGTVRFQYKFNGERASSQQVMREWLLFLSTPIGYMEFVPIMTAEDKVFVFNHTY